MQLAAACGAVCIAALAVVASAPPLRAQAAATRAFRVREAAGIRRTEYPVTAQFSMPRGVLKSATQARLVTGGVETAAQFTSVLAWDDGSVRTLDVDFNASLDPEEERRYELQFGEGVTAAAKPARGLMVEESGDAFQVGNVRFSKSGSPLVASVGYRGEGIGPGANGVAITDANGMRHDLTTAASPSMTLVKGGPLVVSLKYSAVVPLGGEERAPVDVVLEMPNSKTWIKIAATIVDRAQRVRAVAIETPLAFDGLPLFWDFGTDSGTYGVFRNAADSVLLTQTSTGANPRWTIQAGSDGQRRPYETSAGSRQKIASGWGHFQNAKAAVAFGVEQFGRDQGSYTIALDGRGQMAFRFTPASPAQQHRLAVYQHFVSTPVAIGAATNPTAMLSPLAVTIER